MHPRHGGAVYSNKTIRESEKFSRSWRQETGRDLWALVRSADRFGMADERQQQQQRKPTDSVSLSWT